MANREGYQSLDWLREGKFSVREAYNLVRRVMKVGNDKGECSDDKDMRMFWRKASRLPIPNKVKMFAWRVYHNAIPDAKNLNKRNCSVDQCCIDCGYKVENFLHVVKGCWKAGVVWRGLGIQEDVLAVSCEFPADWLWYCAQRLNLTKFRVVICGCWVMWFSRNQARHGGKPMECNDVIYRVKSLVLQWVKWLIGKSRVSKGLWGFIHVREGVCNLYCDCSFDRENNSVGIAVIQLSGNYVKFIFAGYNETCESTLEGEVMALLQGLKTASEMGKKELSIFSDSLGAITTVMKGYSGYAAVDQWAKQAFLMLEANPGWNIEHILRESNVVADQIAQWARVRRKAWSRRDAIPRGDFLSEWSGKQATKLARN